MKDIIKILAEEAVNAVQSRPNGTCDMNKYNQKFAELIVENCISIAKEINVTSDNAWYLSRILKDRFGVEE
jgi:hypothetical protein